MKIRIRTLPLMSLRLLPALIILSTLSGCAVNPTGGADFVLMSENSEIKRGKEEHAKILESQPVYKDAELQAYVDSVGKKMAAISHRPELEYVFTIIDSSDINAFALPGGYVYINRGLLAYLTTEAQLAAVLGHEIGHITARHAVRQQAAGKTANILSTAVVIATGVSTLGETASLFGGALVSGYGRDMELEADGLGAEYLIKAGYDPNAMVEVISVLKNHEDFTKKTSQRAAAYHGLFASHPRSDTRLQEAVRQADDVHDNPAAAPVDPAVFRASTTGLALGPSLQNLAGSDARNRYYQNLLNYTIVFPDAWTFAETPTTVTASAAENEGSLKVEVELLKEAKEPRLFVRENLKIPDLQQAETLAQFGLAGYTGIHPDTGDRVAVVYYGRRAFVFTGAADTEPMKLAILESIKSFRPIARNEGVFADPIKIAWIQADGRVTYADLAKESRLPEFPEETLRLMNGDYPVGEPKAGTWIKIAE
ncbi:MAG: M48 family metalloprotease [Pseudomonadota bacterium]